MVYFITTPQLERFGVIEKQDDIRNLINWNGYDI